jgi:hypothetical protein
LGKKQISKIFLSKYRKGRVKAFCKKCWQYQQLGLLNAGSRNGRKISSDMYYTSPTKSLEFNFSLNPLLPKASLGA